MEIRRFATSALALSLVCTPLAARAADSKTAAKPPAKPAAKSAAKAAGIDLAAIDKSVAPGDDFFRYANGSWVKSTEIPADRSGWARCCRS